MLKTENLVIPKKEQIKKICTLWSLTFVKSDRGQKPTLNLMKLLNANCDTTFDLEKELEELAKVPESKHEDVLLAYPTRRVSCFLVNTPSPCVNKTVEHIQDLGIKIEECFQQFEHLLRERFASTIKMDQLEGYIFPKPSDFHATFIKKDRGDLKHQTETVLAEAIHLIRSLETDRKDAEDALMEQKLRRRLICKKIDSLSFWRLQKLPFAVQKEHEKCLSETLELQWHLEQGVLKLEKLQNQVSKLEVATEKLKEDTDFMKIHQPLLEEKMQMEAKIVKKLCLERDKISEKYDTLHKLLEKLKFDYNLALKMSKKEREKEDRELKESEEFLGSIQGELKIAQNICKNCCSDAEKMEKNVKQKQKELESLSQEKKEVTTKMDTITTAISDLEEAVESQAYKIRELEEDCEDTLTDYLDTKKFWNTELLALRTEFEEILKKSDALIKENKDLVSENKATLLRIKKSLMKKRKFDMDVQTLSKVKIKNDELVQKLLKDIVHVVNMYNSSKSKIEDWEERLTEERKKFSLLESWFKKLTRDQEGIGQLIKIRMDTVTMDQQEERKFLKEKKEQVVEILAKVEKPFLCLMEEVNKCKILQEEHFEEIKGMEHQKNVIIKKMTEVKQSLAQNKSSIQQTITAAEEKQVSVIKKIDIVKQTIFTLNEKIKETKVAQEIKKEEIIVMDKQLGKLRKTLEYEEIRHTNVKVVHDILWNELQTTEVRIDQEKKAFQVLVESRKEELYKYTVEYQDNLEENLRLAQEYQQTLKKFLSVKDCYFNQYSKKLMIEAAIRDKKQIILLQEKMHAALLEFFRLQTLFSKYELELTQERAHGNMCRVILVEKKARNLVERTFEFMQSLLDDSWKTEG
ncbi:coiled-coil domain-containing protein 178 isoform X2 [Macrotis lagotis]|uniref:coiled-coil domain-containing protein 178 isoform X2 n=1 Tax=Macrotis lagotis TaxID=92651 RepID=UPI003D689F29